MKGPLKYFLVYIIVEEFSCVFSSWKCSTSGEPAWDQTSPLNVGDSYVHLSVGVSPGSGTRTYPRFMICLFGAPSLWWDILFNLDTFLTLQGRPYSLWEVNRGGMEVSWGEQDKKEGELGLVYKMKEKF